MHRSASLVLVVAALAPSATAQEVGPKSHHHGERAAAAEVRLYDNLGNHRYPVTASAEAQQYFDQGLRLLWAFNHAESARSFREAERRDPSCGMCAWGVALAVGPNINAGMGSGAADTAAAALARARARAERLPPIERKLITALEARYRSPDPALRSPLDSAWARALADVVAEFPNDLEARSLYADALMNTSQWNYWNSDGSPRPSTPIILENLERVIASNPHHPGACHLFIHAVEAREPARAVPCAERLAQLMPGAGHLVHMPGHIYVRVGRYAEAVEANRHAVHADQTYLEGPTGTRRGFYGSTYYPHNHHFLAFAAAMMGASRLAIESAFRAADAVDPVVAREIPWIEAMTPIGYWTLVTFGRWDQLLAEPLPDPRRRFTAGMAYYARGTAFAAKRRWAEARAALDSVSTITNDYPAGDNRLALEIAEHALAGEIAYRRGGYAEAVREFRGAVAIEDRMAYNEPPIWYYPMRHSLGKALLALRRYGEAERIYREDLERFPENGWSLYGLAQALKGQGKAGEARETLTRFKFAWIDADVELTASRF